MNEYVWIIASLLFLLAVWFCWSILKVFFVGYFQAKALARIELRVNRLAERLFELGCASNAPHSKVWADLIQGIPSLQESIDSDSKIYRDLVNNVNLQELWARIRTRITIGTKNSPKDAEVVGRFLRLISEIETVIQNDFTSRTMAQIGDWNDEKIAFFQNAGVEERASIAAIDQLFADIKYELRV